MKASRLERDLKAEESENRKLAGQCSEKSCRIMELTAQLRGLTTTQAAATTARDEQYRALRQKYDNLVSKPALPQCSWETNEFRFSNPG
jgi:hypothetical protein